MINDKMEYIYGLTEYLEMIDKSYSENLMFQFSTIMPLWDSEKQQLMCSTSKEILTEQKIDSSYFRKEILNKVYRNNKNQIDERDGGRKLLFNLISTSEKKLFDQYVCYFSRESLIILQQMLDYNFYLSARFICRDEKSGIQISKDDKLTKILVESIEIHKRFRKDLRKELVEINNLLAFDKQAIQKGISFINYYMSEDISIKSKKENEKVFKKENIIELLNVVRGLYNFYIILDECITDNTVKVDINDKDLNIKYTESIGKLDGLDLEEYDSMIRFSSNSEAQWLLKYDSNIKQVFGFNLEEMKQFLKQILNLKDKGIHWLLFSLETLCRAFNGMENVDKFCSNFVLEKSYKNNSAFENNKSSRKPIVKYGENTYYATIDMLMIGALNLLEDIQMGQTDKNEFNKIVQKEVHESRLFFEREVAKEIKRIYPESKIKESVVKIGEKELPGEIDVMCLYKDIVYVLECKAASLKFTMKEEQNFIKNFTKKNNKSYVGKLSSKIKFLENNKKELERIFEGEHISAIKGGFVLKNPSMILEKQDIPFPVIHIKNISDIFQ